MYTLGAGRILIKSIIIVCRLNLMAWTASWAHRIGENREKKDDKIKLSVQTSSTCGLSWKIIMVPLFKVSSEMSGRTSDPKNAGLACFTLIVRPFFSCVFAAGDRT